jgi:hypothetical protein
LPPPAPLAVDGMQSSDVSSIDASTVDRPPASPVRVSARLTVRALPTGFEPRSEPQRLGGGGEMLTVQHFVSRARQATVVIAIQEHHDGAAMFAAPTYRPSTLTSPGIGQLYEYANLTSLKSNVLGWRVDGNTIVTVTSREISADELFDFVSRIEVIG